ARSQAGRPQRAHPGSANPAARARFLFILPEREGRGKRKCAARHDGFSPAAQVSDRHGPGMERMGFRDLPRALGESTDKDGNGKSHRTKTAPACALRVTDVEDLG